MSYAGAFVTLGAAMAAHDEAVAAARAEQRRKYEITRSDVWRFPAPAKKPKPSKCDSCGSREWLAHDGKEVCAYCRSDRA